MLGAIIGDIAGSRFEFTLRSTPILNQDLFPPEANYTDDTLMTLAVYKGLIDAAGDLAKGPAALRSAMRSFGKQFTPLPRGSFGSRFAHWLSSTDPQPYGSCGNGSAMRVSSVGWLFPTLTLTEQWAEITATLTHNHPEGIKGAQATAAAIFLARTGKNKQQLAQYLHSRYSYDLSQPWEEIANNDNGEIVCQITVPQAISAFLKARDFQECIRLAISPGGDTDTRAAIAGSIAEAYYGIDNANWREEAKSRLDPPLAGLLAQFETETLAQRLVAVLSQYYEQLNFSASEQQPSTTSTPQHIGQISPIQFSSVKLTALTARLRGFGLMEYQDLTVDQSVTYLMNTYNPALNLTTTDAAHLAAILIRQIPKAPTPLEAGDAVINIDLFNAITHRAYELAGLAFLEK